MSKDVVIGDIKTHLISFFGLGLFIQLFSRMPYIRYSVPEILFVGTGNSEAIADYFDNPIKSGISGYVNFFFGNWGRSFLTGQYTFPSILPFIEKSAFIIVSFIAIIILSVLFAFLLGNTDNIMLKLIFRSYFPSLLYSIFIVYYIFSNYQELAYTGFEDLTFPEIKGFRILYSVPAGFTILLVVRSYLLTLDFNSDMEFLFKDISRVVLVSIRSNLQYFFMLWYVISAFLRLPALSSRFRADSYYFDMSMITAILMVVLTVYYVFMLSLDGMLYLVSENYNISTPQETYEVSWKQLFPGIIGFGIFVLLAIMGFMLSDSITSFLNQDIYSETFIGSEEHPLGLDQRGFDILALFFVSCYVFVLVFVLVSLFRILFLWIINQSKQLNWRAFINFISQLPVIITIPVFFLFFLFPLDTFYLQILTWSIISTVFIFPQPLLILENDSSRSYSRYYIFVITTFLTTFIQFQYLGFFKLRTFPVGLLTLEDVFYYTLYSDYSMFGYFFVAVVFFFAFILISALVWEKSESKEGELYPENDKN